MCTAITYKSEDFYFGRNLDVEFSYNETVVITPRNYRFKFRKSKHLRKNFAIIGMATVEDNYPLYYDAVNEKGLCIAGLNFPENAVYNAAKCDKDNIAPFELIPFILGRCTNVKEAKKLLLETNIADIDFSEKYPNTPLHWMISDKKQSITVEQTKDGLKVYDNPVGVLTNNPPFETQMFLLNNYMNVTKNPPKNFFSKEISLKPYSRGMGGIGLPGDLSSASRFVRAAFTKLNSVSEESENKSVSQFFHILGAVCQQRGCVKLGDKYEITVYSSCCNADKGIYYYRTYENSQINAVNMNKEDLDSKELIIYKLANEQSINFQN